MKFNLKSKNDIKRYAKTLEARYLEVRNKFTEKLKENLEKNTPKKTGRLSRSYKIQKKNQDLTIVNDAGYCKYVNDGTSKMRGRHFIEKSIAQTKESFKDIAKKAKNINK